MSTISLIISIILLVFMGFYALMVFAMAHSAGRYDEVSESIYQSEMKKRLEEAEKFMDEADSNPEYIDPEDK